MSLPTNDAIRRFGLPMITDGKAIVQDNGNWAYFVLPAAPGWHLLALPVREERKPVAADVQKREVFAWRLGEEEIQDGYRQQSLEPMPRTARDACDTTHLALLSPNGRILGIDSPRFGRGIRDAEFPTTEAWVDAVVEEWTAWRKERDAYETKICPTCGKYHDDDDSIPF